MSINANGNRDPFVAVNSKNSLTFKYEEYVKKGQKHIKVVESKFSWTPERLVFKLENLFGGDKAIDDNINQVFNDNWKELNDDVAPNFKRCNRKQPDFKECFFKAVEHAVSQMTVSMKEVGLPKLDPMSIPSMSIAAGTSAAAFEQNYENITLSGFTKNNCSKIEIDFDEKTMHLDCGSDLIVMNFDYEFIGNILLLPIRSKGPGKVDIIKPKNVLTLKFEEYEKKGKQYIRITDHKFLWTPQELVFNLENLFGDNEALNKNLNDVFNENWKALYDDSDQWDDVFDKYLRHLRGRYRKAPPGIPVWVIGTSFAETTRVPFLRVYPTVPGNPTFVVKAVLECSRAECRRRFLRWTDLDVVLWTR
ncbi:hypothetical protein GEV33_006480 [Tenebrio molitor]|uniref:Uncharacterized protein n=1 Tax=Tenebrio molitor TaxID=7067 RepID=A0A8J6HLQ9_TENMO|nr:hypothetical protein GEV33_006480 [Tenebrio molitor]